MSDIERSYLANIEEKYIDRLNYFIHIEIVMRKLMKGELSTYGAKKALRFLERKLKELQDLSKGES